jgi:predicted amidophosphoribosyltransferase
MSLADEIASEMAADVRSLLGAGGFKAIVPMPCGHSAPGRCLSSAIARSLGRRLKLPVTHALSLAVEKGTSHPKTNASRSAMALVAPAEGPVLLVDDVTTSGRHIEEAVNLLRKADTAAMAIAWIGGDAGAGE